MIGVFTRRGQSQTASQSEPRGRVDLSYHDYLSPGCIDRFIDKPFTGTIFAILFFIHIAFLLEAQRGEPLNYHYILAFIYSILLVYFFISAAATRENETMLFCASCGIAGVDDIKLKECDDFDLVKYCNEECQKDHRSKDKEDCQKRAAELHDEILFKQPESSHIGDCPICCLPLPLTTGPAKPTFMTCCSKYMCIGCDIVQTKLGLEGKLELKCPFCREALPATDEEENEQVRKRIEANDPEAICRMGMKRCEEGDYKAAFEYWTRAAALGDVKAHFHLSIMYQEGKCVEKDEKRSLHHAEQAAIAGYHLVRHNLACMEWKNGKMDRAVKHWIIAAKQGEDESLTRIKNLYQLGYVSKEDFAAALRGHQAAIDATKSPQREAAYKFYAENSWIVR